MYASYFGLAREPFSIAPDPRFLFLSEQHREALAHLLYGVGGGGGFVLLTGEIGAGKTTVCRCFLQQVPPHCSVAYLFNPQFDTRELMAAICEEFGIPPVPEGSGLKAQVDALNGYLLDQHAQGRAVVLAIDEAQGLAPSVLEQLRLLTNLETSERKLLQIVLIGQPELRTLLKRPDLEQLAQRVIARYHLGPLSAADTAAYVRHRILVAGVAPAAADAPSASPRPRSVAPPLPFDDAALAEIHRRTGGVPRRINVLCDRALLGAYSQGRAQVDARIVARAAAEVFALDEAPTAPPPVAPRRFGWAWALAGGAGALALAAWAVWVAGLQAPVSGLPPVAVPTPAAASTPVAQSQVLPATVPAQEPPPVQDPAELLLRAWLDPAQALAALEAAHRLEDAADNAAAPDRSATCSDAALLRCWQGRGGLPAVQQAERPALLVLQGRDGSPAWLLLTGHQGSEVRLRGPGDIGPDAAFRAPISVLAGVWRGEFTVLWRPPAGWRESDARAAVPTPSWAAWLDQSLQAQVRAEAGVPWRERVLAFQLAQGLPADGLPGPLTLMRLQRLAGDAPPAR